MPKLRSPQSLKFGRAVRELRLAKRWTQEDLGDASGLHRTYVGSVERGERNPTLLAVDRLLAVLGISWAEFGALVERSPRVRGPK